MTRWRYSQVGCVNPPTNTKHSGAIKTPVITDNPLWTWMKPWCDGFGASSWETLLFTCTEENRVRKSLHSSCSDCVLGDMAQPYKILWVVSSQRAVSKHAASVWLLACLSLRPQSAHITWGEAPPFNRMKSWFTAAERWSTVYKLK